LGKAARTIFLRVEEGIGEISPSNILKTQDRKFRKFGLSRQKTSYLKDLARRTLEKEIKLKKLDKLSEEKVIEELVKVRGIGRWTAEMFLMFTLARQDVFPADDLGIQKGTEKLLKRKLNALKMAKFADRWRPYRTLASWYIWKTLDNE
jgi:DNA-3-methyladenine glycosylase II